MRGAPEDALAQMRRQVAELKVSTKLGAPGNEAAAGGGAAADGGEPAAADRHAAQPPPTAAPPAPAPPPRRFASAVRKLMRLRVVYGGAVAPTPEPEPAERSDDSAPGSSAPSVPATTSGDRTTAWAVALVAQRWRKKANSALIPFLAPFVPRFLQEEVAGVGTGFLDKHLTFARRQQAIAGPCAASRNVAVLLADISGFTPLTETLSKKGPRGVEILTKCINAYFTAAIEIVHRHGGDVIKFAGDAMIIVFQAEASEQAEGDDDDIDITAKSADEIAAMADAPLAKDAALRRATARATWCAASLAGKLGHVEMQQDGSVKPLKIDVKKSVGAEALKVFQDAANKGSTRRLSATSSRMLLAAKIAKSQSQSPEPTAAAAAAALAAAAPPAGAVVEMHSPSIPSSPSARMSNSLSRRGSLAALAAALPDKEMDGSQRAHAASTAESSRGIPLFIRRLAAPFSRLFRAATPEASKAEGRSGPSFFRSFSGSRAELASFMFKSSRSMSNTRRSFPSRSSSMKDTDPLPAQNDEDDDGSLFEGDPPRLSLKLVVAAGEAIFLNVGGGASSSTQSGIDGNAMARYEFLVADPPHVVGCRAPFRQIEEAESEAEPGDIILSAEAVAQVQDDFQLELRPTGNARLMGLTQAVQWRMRASAKANEGSFVGAINVMEATLKEIYLPEFSKFSARRQAMAVKRIRRYIVGQVRDRVEAGHHDFTNEIRVMSVVFFGFPALRKPLEGDHAPPDTDAALDKVQSMLLDVQRELRKHGGTLLQCRCDEKGYLAVCAFGLPGQAFSDHPARAISCACSVLTSEGAKAAGAVAGVTTGQLFCAVVGAPQRVEYTVFGDAINLAARLMVKAKKGLGTTGLLCDGITHESCGRSMAARFRRLPPLEVKGKAELVAVSEVDPVKADMHKSRADAIGMSVIDAHHASLAAMERMEGPLIEREDAFAALEKAAVGSLRPKELRVPAENTNDANAIFGAERSEQVVIIQGGQGTGKTHMIKEALRISKEHGLHHLRIVIPEDLRHERYAAWIVCLILLEDEVSQQLLKGDQALSHKLGGVAQGEIARLKAQFLAASNMGDVGTTSSSSLLGSVEEGLDTVMSKTSGSSKQLRLRSNSSLQHISLRDDSALAKRAPILHSSSSTGDLGKTTGDSRKSHDDLKAHNGRNWFSDISLSTSGRHAERALVKFLFDLMKQIPIAFLADDVGLWDDASLEVLDTLLSMRPPGMFVLSRDLEQGAEGKRQVLIEKLNGHATQDIHLNLLTRDGTKMLIHLLMKTNVPESITDDLYARSAGHPNYIRHILKFLSDSRKRSILAGKSDAVGEGELRMFLAQETGMEAKFTQQFDALSAKQQLVLKVASVISDQITAKLIVAVHPLHPPILAVERDLAELVAKAFLKPMDHVLSSNEPDSKDESQAQIGQFSLEFGSDLLRNSVYELVPTIQRSKLHESAARCGLVPLEVAVMHAKMARQFLLAIDLLEQDAAEHERLGDYSKAAKALEHAIELGSPSLRIAVRACEVSLRVNDIDLCVSAFLRALSIIHDDKRKAIHAGKFGNCFSPAIADDDSESKDETVRPMNDLDLLGRLCGAAVYVSRLEPSKIPPSLCLDICSEHAAAKRRVEKNERVKERRRRGDLHRREAALAWEQRKLRWRSLLHCLCRTASTKYPPCGEDEVAEEAGDADNPSPIPAGGKETGLTL